MGLMAQPSWMGTEVNPEKWRELKARLEDFKEYVLSLEGEYLHYAFGYLSGIHGDVERKCAEEWSERG